MSPSALALTLIFSIVLLGSALGFYAGTRRKMSLEQWTVGGRAFGTLILWLLMAGEIYTAFSFLGVSGWAYSRGGPALYIFGYLTLGNVIGFFILPPIWELGHKHGMQTLGDFFLVQYGSKYLAAIVSAIGVVFMIPYLQVQLTGLGIIMEVASFDGIGRTPAMLIAVVLLAGFVFANGIRAVAWVSVLKDLLMVVAVIAIGIWVPHFYFGGIGPMFAAIERAKPGHLLMPGATNTLGHGWYVSTVLMTSLGILMWPHFFGANFTARSAEILRRNCVVLPLYSISLVFPILTGLAAFLAVPGLANPDLSLLAVVRKAFPVWMLGLIGGAGALTAMVPAAIIILSASTLFSKNLVRSVFAPNMTDDQVARLARFMVVVLSLISFYFAVHSSTTLVSLALLGYAGVAQFFPGVILSLCWRRTTMAGAACGIAMGVGGTAMLVLMKRDPFHGMNAGFVGLCANFGAVVAVSLLAPAHAPAAEAIAQELPPAATDESAASPAEPI